MDSKTYSSKNLKFVLIQVFVLLATVSILLYLLFLKSFTPINEQGAYIWENIFTLMSLFFLILVTFSSLISYILLRVILKKEDCLSLKIVSIKWGIYFTIGIFLVLILNFFHILNIYWGLGIFLLVILASFII